MSFGATSLPEDFGDEVDYDNSRPGRGARLVPGLSFKLGYAWLP